MRKKHSLSQKNHQAPERAAPAASQTFFDWETEGIFQQETKKEVREGSVRFCGDGWERFVKGRWEPIG